MQVHKNFTIFLLLALRVSGKKNSENYTPDLQDDKPQDYTFSYGVNDAHTGDQKNQWEKKEGDVVTGSYSVAEPDGTIRTVEYTADDKNGFKAVVKYSRPNIVHNEIQKDSLGPSKIQLDHIDVHPISADYVSSSQLADIKPTLVAQPIKNNFAILENQYENKPESDKWSPIITKPRAFQTIYQQELSNETPYQNVYISTAASNDVNNINKEKPSYTASHPNKEIFNPGERDLYINQQQYVYPVYQYQHIDTRDSQKYHNTYFQPVVPPTRSQRSNKRLEATYNYSAPYISSSASSAASGLKYTSDTENQYKVMNPSHTVNYLQDSSSFKPSQKIIPIDVGKTNVVENNFNPNQQKHFYPWYKYDETPKLRYGNFQPVTSSDSTSQLSGTGYKSPYYGNVATPSETIRNYGTSVMTQYPIIRNNYEQNPYYSNNLPSLIINKQLERHPQVNLQNFNFGRLHPRSSNNREFTKYAKTVTYVED